MKRLTRTTFYFVTTCMLLLSSFLAASNQSGRRQRSELPEFEQYLDARAISEDIDSRYGTRNIIPPTNLTARIIDNVNISLNWDRPTDLIRIAYHSGNPHDGFVQLMTEGYGTVFDLSEYEDVTLEFVDFRHSDWNLEGEWDYEIIAVNWETGELLKTISSQTTLNDGWERDLSLDSTIPTGDLIGIFLLPRGYESDDAYPVLDMDHDMHGNSMIITIDEEGYHFEDETDGDFLIDLLVRATPPARSTKPATVSAPRLKRIQANNERALFNFEQPIGYNVYRNGEVISEIESPDSTTYLDENLEDGEYTYYVTALYEEDESEPSNEVKVEIIADLEVVFFDNFSSYPDFVLNFPPWTTIDMDGSDTWGFENHNFPNMGQPMAFMIFNPSEVTPELEAEPHSGTKMAASFSSIDNRNDNWLISPQILLGDNSSLSFFARTYNPYFGYEEFRVGVSRTQPDPGSFQIVHPVEGYEQAPAQWTEFNVDLSNFDNEEVYIAIQCGSDDTFIFLLDSFTVYSVGGSNVENDMIQPHNITAGNYPNPFNPETTIYYSLQQDGFVHIDIYNTKGQNINTIVTNYHQAGKHNAVWNGTDKNGNEVTSGIYYYRIETESEILNGKMLMLK